MLKEIKEKLENLYIVKNYKNIYPYVKPYWVRAMLAVLITFPVGIMDSIVAWALKPYMDVVMIEKNIASTSYVPLLIIGFSFMQSALTYSSAYLNAWVGARISNGLKQDLFKKLMRYDAGFFDSNSSGAIQFKFNSDVDTACNGLLNNLRLFTTRAFSSISLVIVLFINSWRLAIVAIITLLIAFFPLTRIRKRIRSIISGTVAFGGLIVTHYIEVFNGNRVISSFNLYDYQLKKFKKSLAQVIKLSMKMVQKTGILSPMMHFIVSVGIAVVLWIGSYLIFHNQLSIGGFVSFITALLLLYQPVKSIGNDFNALHISFFAMERVFDLLKRSPKILNKPNAKKLNEIKKSIVYQDVTFGYKKDKIVLSNINLEINVGETIAFVGNSGGGKTTMASLLPRFYEITSGKILIDGTDIRDLKIDSLRDKIAVVFQDNFLFSGTIRENILLGNDVATQKDIELAIRSACLDEFIDSLKLGLDREIGERGVLLSGGQKQRVAIARAFIKNSPIVILDEATSALDNKSEAIVQKAINNLMKDRTVFVIAHRLSTIKNADRIVVVNNGKIAEIGTHETLIQKNDSIYHSLYNVSEKK